MAEDHVLLAGRIAEGLRHAGLARTPLTVMRATLDVVLDMPAPAPGELHRMSQDVRAALDHAERLINALLTLARSDRGLTVREPVDLATPAEDVLDATDRGDRRLHASLESAVASGDQYSWSAWSPTW